MGDHDPIRHVIVLMLENRPFDQMIGGLQGEISGLDGVDTGAPPRTNYCQGVTYNQAAGAAYTLNYDPHHEYEHVQMQLRDRNGGFVEDFALSYPDSGPLDRAEIMKYHAAGALPALHALARNFTVCDHWFASVPGPTWTNRFFVHSGTSIGRVAMPNGLIDGNWHWYDQITLYDRLNESRKRWCIYYGDIPQSLILVHQTEPHNAAGYHKMTQFYRDVAGKEADFPDFAFIEPSYYPPGANDDHPPHDLRAGQRLIGDVYNALRANESLWMSSLLVVLYDEHGGMYDHVIPPAGPPYAIAPDHHTEEFTFDRFGVRVPAILVSPYMDRRVLPTIFDHTSLLKYLIDKWKLGALGARAAAANSFASALLANARTDTPLSIDSTGAAAAGSPGRSAIANQRASLSSNQSALFGMTQLLESASDSPPGDLSSRLKRMVTGFDGQVDVAIERTDQFLEQQRKRV